MALHQQPVAKASATAPSSSSASFGVFLGPVAFAIAQCCFWSSTPFARLTEKTLILGETYYRRIGTAHFVVAAIHALFAKLFAPTGFFGVEGRHFETIFLVREVVETVLQAFQAYQMSRLLPREQLNRFYVAALVLNCWTTPFFQRVFRGRRQALTRLLCLLSDIVLDFTSAVGVPVLLAIDYATAVFVDSESSTLDFPQTLWYNDAWLVRLMNDAPLILLDSWLDAASRLVFSLSMFFTIEDIKHLIKRKAYRDSVVNVAVVPRTSPKGTLDLNSPEHVAVSAATYQAPSAFVRWAHRVLILAGAIILGAQVHAESVPRPSLCVLQVRPWFISHPSCALMETNCLTHPNAPAAVEAAFNNVNKHSLQHVVIRHCPRVVIPQHMQAFHSLVGFKTYNVSIASWGSEAAITQSHHPNLRFLNFVRTTFANASLPLGLISREFPTKVRVIEICSSNLNWLPDDLHERWPKRLTLYIEYSDFTEYQTTLQDVLSDPVTL